MDIKKQLIEEIFEEHFDRIYRFFYYKILNREDSEDLTSETFLALVKKIKTSGKIAKYENYLYGIASNVFAAYLRKRYEVKLSSVEIEKLAEEIDDADKDKNIKKIAEKFIKKLPAKQKAVIHLRLIEKKSLKEICKILEKDMNYVKTTQQRAIYNLKKLIACTPLTT